MKVYFIDDCKMYLENIKEYFQDTNINIKTFPIRSGYDIEEVEKTIKNEKPEIIFCDQGMPCVDGATLIQRIRKTYNPVSILVSAMPGIGIHKNEFDYVMQKQGDLVALEKTINIIIQSFEIEEERDIEQFIDSFEDLTYNDKKVLKQVVKRFKDVEKAKDITYADAEMRDITKKSSHALIEQFKRMKNKLGKNEIESKVFLFDLIRDIYKRGTGNNDK